MKFSTLFSVILTIAAQTAYANDSCSAKARELNCGEKIVSEAGCSVNCSAARESEEPLCTPADCHPLTDHSYDYICNRAGVKCVLGNDYREYVVNPASCFCD